MSSEVAAMGLILNGADVGHRISAALSMREQVFTCIHMSQVWSDAAGNLHAGPQVKPAANLSCQASHVLAGTHGRRRQQQQQQQQQQQ